MSQFIISCTTCSLRGVSSDEISSTLEFAPRAGYSAWGLAHPGVRTNLGAARWFDAKKVKEAARAVGLYHCTEVYGCGLPSGDFSVDDVNNMVELFQVADDLESPYVVITGNGRKETGLEQGVQFLTELDKRIGYFNARLALEPHMNSQLMTLEDYRYIFSRVHSERIGITLDTGHFYSAGVDVVSFVREFGEKIYNIHLKDHIGAQSVPIGTGEIDLRGMIEELHKIGYIGALAVEIEPTDPPMLPKYCKDAYEYLEDLVQDITQN